MGDHVDGSFSEIVKVSSVKECSSYLSAQKMLKNLADDQKLLSDTMLKLSQGADDLGDAVTNDLSINRAAVHDKFVWMLRAHFEA